MNLAIKNQEKSVATLIHLSVFSQFFIPFGNFILPVILWSLKKQDPFVDNHGRSALNFQISLFLYTTFILTVGFAAMILMGINLFGEETFLISENQLEISSYPEFVPLLILGLVIAILLVGLFLLQIFAVISAVSKAGDGELYKYPLSINFLGRSENAAIASEEK